MLEYNKNANTDINKSNASSITNLHKYLTENKNVTTDVNKYIVRIIKTNKVIYSNIFNNLIQFLSLINTIPENIFDKILINNINTKEQLINIVYNNIKDNINDTEKDKLFSYLCTLEYVKNSLCKDKLFKLNQILDICIDVLILLNFNNIIRKKL